jgi:hypothetical protein
MDIKNYIYITAVSRGISILEEYIKHNNNHVMYILLLSVSVYLIYILYENIKSIDFINHNNNESSIIISSHRKKGNNSILSNDTEYITLYSKYFRSISHYILNNNDIKINHLIEKNSIENTLYKNIEYILLPDIGNKILICKKRNIYFEIINNKILENNQYIILTSYKLTIPTLNKVNIIKKFLDECEMMYNTHSNKNKQQTIFEYIDNYINQDEYNIELMFYEHPFISNKILGKNIFYDELPQLISYIEQFIPENYEINKAKYANMGTPYKASILLHGPPGCGKSSTIKGILNKTGRHGLIVQWSKLKTCREFCSLFRNPVINGTKYNLSEICYIFEDFDANANNIIKTRIELKQNYIVNNNEQDIKKIVESIKENNKIDKIDLLTLDCILNVLDGILELDNAMIIFTTNIPLVNIDPAFIRAGRIDFKLHLTYCSVNTICKIIQLKFGNIDNPIDKGKIKLLIDNILLPCDVQNICFKHNNITDCVDELLQLQNKK